MNPSSHINGSGGTTNFRCRLPLGHRQFVANQIEKLLEPYRGDLGLFDAQHDLLQTFIPILSRQFTLALSTN